MITHNVDKDYGVVNGAFGILRDYKAGHVLIELESGYVAWLHRFTFEIDAHSTVTGFPIVPGYATTLAKMQGRALDSITIWPVVSCEASGYVAITRVRQLEHIFWVETPCTAFFRPPCQD